MTKLNRIVLAIFFGILTLVVVGVVAWDVSLATMEPSGSTISWSMALLGAESPISIYFLGILCGAAFIGLPVHFWGGMVSPAEWDQEQADKAELGRLRAQLATLGQGANSSNPR